MSTGEIAALIGSSAAFLGAGGWIARLSLQVAERRKLEAESLKALAEAGGAKSGDAKNLFLMAGELIDDLREEVARLKGDREETRKEERSCKEQLREAEKRIVALERAVAGLEGRA